MKLATHPALDRALRAELARGPLPFRRFMELALYHPEGGYYCQPRPRIGTGGDFVTGPHQSPWLGRILARQLEALWEAMDRPGAFSLIEYGAGEGWLARDIFEAVAGAAPPAFASVLDCCLIERGPAAAGRIAERIAPWTSRAEGRPRARVAGSPPAEFEGLVLAHEFLDALPVHLLAGTGAGLRERYVRLEEGGLAMCEGPLTDARLGARLAEMGAAPAPGQMVEVCLAAEDWIEGVAARLRRGGVLVFDYGRSARMLYHPSRGEGTLRGFRGHAVRSDPLENPGETDLTADVNFTALLGAAERAGLALAGFTDQCHFLLAAGLAEALEAAGEGARRERIATMGLLDPGGLGGAIKVMLLTRGLAGAAFPAFAMKPHDRDTFATLRG